MTDTDITALIERLREYGPHDERSAFRICDEAADALEALLTVNEALLTANKDHVETIMIMLARAEKVEAALVERDKHA